MLHNEEISKYSLENLPNFTNLLTSNTEEGNNNFTFKKTTSQPNRLEFVEATIKYTSAHEDDKHWYLVRIREMNNENTIMSIWYFKSNI